MSSNKRIILVEKMLCQTRSGNVDWEETVNGNEFLVTKVSLSILVSKGQGNNGALYIIKILNEYGEIIDEFNDETWGYDEHVSKIFAELYNLARGYAMGTEQALDRLLYSFDDVPF